MLKKYKIEHNIPTLDEYKYLCESVGWTNYVNFEVVESSLNNSIYYITVKVNKQIVGMGKRPSMTISCSSTKAVNFHY